MAINTKYKITKGSPESLLSVAKISDKDLPLIQRLELDTAFTPSGNRIDVFFYALDGRFLSSIVDSKNYSVIRGGSTEGGIIEDITLNPQKDSIDAGYVNGDVNVLYNFVNNLLSEKNAQPKLFIESISPDRTEIRALTNDVSTRRLIGFIDNAKARLNDSSYFEDFRLNFGRNNLPIGINLDRVPFRDTQAVIIKLYEPLPASIQVKDTFLLEELVGDSVLYQVETEVSSTAEDVSKALRGPNYNIELVEENNNPTGYLSYNELFSYPVTNSYYEVYSLFNEKGAQLSIDHTDFSDFIHFSSAEERLRNFYYKASLLESYRNQIDARNTYTGSIDESIRGIINNFDHYDRYLYFETGSTAWPKNTIIRPYRLQSTGSSEVQTWYTDQLNSASLYDAQNNDRLINSIPSFIREDTNNAPYALFVDMVGQHFDNLWIYMKGVTSKYDADNRLDFGISKDLVREAVEGFGVTLYNNNEALENLFAAFTGETYDSGSEQISSLIVAVEGSGSLTGSIGNEHLQPMPKSSYQKEVYKRIYHNIPLLTKSKGTERGLRALINSFGIPFDVLKIRTFGGQDNTATPFYGPSTEITSSLGKIRVSNTDAVVTGSTLSNYTSVVNYGDDYSKDLHTVEIGFSPTENLDSYIKSHPSMSAFDLDSYIGDPGYAYSGSYSGLSTLAETVFTSGSAYTGVYNAFDFVRLIKFFDNSIFRIIKDFVPARSNIDTGIIIKPHILDRSKIKQPEVKWSNQSSPSFTHTGTQLDYTGSYYSTNFSIDGNITTAFISGTTGLGSIDSASYSYTETYANPSGGYQTLTRNNQDEAAYTGELSGSIITTTSGDLTVGNTFRKLEPEQFSFKYIPRNDFTTPEAALDLYRKTVSLNNIVESTAESPSQAGEGSTPLVLSIPAYNSAHNYNKVAFKLNGGPIDGTPATDSGSIQWQPDEELDNGDSVLINFTVDFKDISNFVETGGDLTEITLGIYSGSAGSGYTPVALETVTRTSLDAQQETITLYYRNTGSLLIEDPMRWYWQATYSSKYDTEYELTNIVDAEISLAPILTYYDPDTITVWISETIENEFTSSRVEALSVPQNSPTNGSTSTYITQADEIVFQYEAFDTTDNYDNTVITSSVEGGSYRAAVTIVDKDIDLTHITSAPYSASFRQQLPDLTDGDTLKFNFTVDFDSYWSTYLNTYDFSNTPFVTASIRNRNTGAVTGSLSYSLQQGQYPNEYRRTLSYLNDTGGDLSDLEFYYQINIPKADKGAGYPQVNLKDISVSYNTPQTVYLKDSVLSAKNIGYDIVFIELTNKPEIASGSLDYFSQTVNYYNVGFIPGETELFRFNDYASTSNNIDSIRRSSNRLIVDEKTYTPTEGIYRGFFLPGNFSIISSSIANGVEGLDQRFFAEIQDSNYYATGWRNGRYDGSITDNSIDGNVVLGREPALNYSNFNGYLFKDTATTSEIKAIFSGSSQIEEENLQVYFNTYELNKKSDLIIYSGTDASVETNAALITRSETEYKININDGAGAAGGTYSGSIGPIGVDNLIKVQYTVLFENLNQTEISSATSQLAVKLLDGITQVANEAIDITGIAQGTVQNFTTYLNPSSDVITADLQFNFTGFEGDGAGTPDITLNLIKIERFTDSTLIPSTINSENILSTGTYQRSILRRQVKPTPTNSSGYERIVASKIYRPDTKEVYTVNNRGTVTNIE